MATATTRTVHVDKASVDTSVARLKELKINFLAIDFDQTIIDIHTGGRWNGTVEELVEHVRPQFPPLLEKALLQDIHVAIVTFSSQIDLVRGVLCHVLDKNLAQQIPIRAGGHFGYNGIGIREGKQAHMASAVEELESSQEGLEITKSTSLLIDDDVKNIRTALRDGVRAIWLNPRNSDALLHDITRLL